MFERIFQAASKKLKRYSGLFVLFLCFILLWAFLKNVARMNRVRENVEEAEGRVGKLKQEGEELEAKLEVVKGEEFVEKQLRDKLGLAKEGEIVIILPEDEIVRKFAPKQTREEEVLPDPNWKKWIKLFY